VYRARRQWWTQCVTQRRAQCSQYGGLVRLPVLYLVRRRVEAWCVAGEVPSASPSAVPGSSQVRFTSTSRCSWPPGAIFSQPEFGPRMLPPRGSHSGPSALRQPGLSDRWSRWLPGALGCLTALLPAPARALCPALEFKNRRVLIPVSPLAPLRGLEPSSSPSSSPTFVSLRSVP
jgi:hypothetical protein